MSSTHPVDPEQPAGDAADGQANPTNLPVEPEFGDLQPPVEPEDPGADKPKI